MTMKYSRDEVIKALDHCIHLNGVSVLDNHDECFDCPFRTDGEDTCVSMVPLLDSALKLLTEQPSEEKQEDKERVIKALETCNACLHPLRYMETCPDIKELGFDNLGCVSSGLKIRKAALELLKENESVKAVFVGGGSYECEKCRETVGWDDLEVYGIDRIRYRYCPGCGKKVLWE